MTLPADLSEALARYIADEPDAPDEAEAIRRILRDWLIGHRYLPVTEADKRGR